MEKKVLEIEITKINERYSACYISYQNEEILKRGIFEDKELEVYSCSEFEWIVFESKLYLQGTNKENDLKIILINNKEVEKLKEKIDAINEKYGIKKRWRAKIGEEYWHIKTSFDINLSLDVRSSFDDTLYKIGNYFQTKEEAEIYAEKFKKILQERE